MPDDAERHAGRRAEKGHAGGNRGGRNIGQGRKLFEQLTVKGVYLFGVGEAIVAQREAERKDVILAKAEIDARQFPEAMDGESRAGKKGQRQRKFDHHKAAAQSLTTGAGGGTAALF